MCSDADGNNTLVNIHFDVLTGSIRCIFLTTSPGNFKTCNILYGRGEDCRNFTYLEKGTTTAVNTVTVRLPEDHLKTVTQYCYIAKAGNGSFFAMVKGVFSTGLYYTVATDTSFPY